MGAVYQMPFWRPSLLCHTDTMPAVATFVAMFAFFAAGATGYAMPVASHDGMVVTGHPLASNAGRDMLRAGGTACDAAVAAALTLAVVEPPCSGLGGGGMALVRASPQTATQGGVRLLDFREVAPAAAQPSMFLRDGEVDWDAASDGALAVAVPGAVAGLVELHADCGVLPLSQVVAPAVAAARQGFAVDLRYRRVAQFRLAALQLDAEAARLFLRRDAQGQWQAPAVGEIIVQPDLARTLEGIGQDGGAAFYRGAIAAALVRHLQDRGGILTVEDLQRYAPKWRAPLLGSYHGHALVTAPLPSRGGMHLITVLNLLETAADDAPWHSLPWLQRYLEGTKIALADAWLLGDPAFLPDAGLRSAALTSKLRAHTLSSQLEHPTVPPAVLPPGVGTPYVTCNNAQPPCWMHRGSKEPSHTTHVAVVDGRGGAVSLTQSLNAYWGVGQVAPNTGVLLNNQMNDFDLQPRDADPCGLSLNTIAPGKAPLSHMTPTMVFADSADGPLVAVIGSPGGRRIPGIVAQAVAAIIDTQVDVDIALAQRRLDYNPYANTVEMERFALEPPTLEALTAAGYGFEVRFDWGNAMAIGIDVPSGMILGAADVRGVGLAVAP